MARCERSAEARTKLAATKATILSPVDGTSAFFVFIALLPWAVFLTWIWLKQGIRPWRALWPDLIHFRDSIKNASVARASVLAMVVMYAPLLAVGLLGAWLTLRGVDFGILLLVNFGFPSIWALAFASRVFLVLRRNHASRDVAA
jgi:hypothetical protein